MQNKTYTSLGNIRKFLRRNHVLKGILRIKSAPTANIPITDIFISHDHWIKNKYFSFHFDTLDQVTNPMPNIDLYHLINYFRVGEENGFCLYDHIKHHKLLSREIGVDYYKGSFKLPIHMIRYQFRMCKHQFYIAKFLTRNDGAIYLLCSPDLDKTWLTKLSLKMTKLSNANLNNILTLIDLHLINPIHTVVLHNSVIDNREFLAPNKVKYNQIDKTISIDNPFTTLKMSLVPHMKVYLQQYVNSDPMLALSYPRQSRLTILITFTPVKTSSFRKMIK